MIMKRGIRRLRRHWQQTHSLLRDDGHFANPELMALIRADGHADFLFGLAGNAVLARQADALMNNSRGHLALLNPWPPGAWGRPSRPCVTSVNSSMPPAPGRKPSGGSSRPTSWPAATSCPPRTIRVRGHHLTQLLAPGALPAGRLRPRAGGKSDQTGEGRSEIRPHLGFQLPGRLRPPAVLCQCLRLAPATAPPGFARHPAGHGPAEDRHAHLVQQSD